MGIRFIPGRIVARHAPFEVRSSLVQTVATP
jgi:hypothetical protein